MILLGNLLYGLGVILSQAITLYMIVLFVAVLITWFSPDPNNILVRFLHGATEPLLAIIRRKVPPLGMLDISPIIAFLGLILAQYVIAQTLMDYGQIIRVGGGPAIGGPSEVVGGP